MLKVVENPKGMDVSIRYMQEALHAGIVERFGLAGHTLNYFEVYPRCYRNKTVDGYVAEFYAGGGQYSKVYYDSTLAGRSFFGAGDIVKKGIQNTVQIHLVFMVNLDKLGFNTLHRPDEEMHNVIRAICGRYSNGFTFTSLETGLINVLKEYSGSLRDQNLHNADMHPAHLFRLNFDLTYNEKQCYS